MICNLIQEASITVFESDHAAACQSKLSGKLASQTNKHTKQTMSINRGKKHYLCLCLVLHIILNFKNIGTENADFSKWRRDY